MKDYDKTIPENRTETTALTPIEIVNGLFSLLDDRGHVVSLNDQGQIPPAALPSDDLIPLKEWAIRNGIAPATARQKAGRGALKTARKVGRDWMISRYEPNIDHRSKDGLLAIDGPIHIDAVLNYLLQLNSDTLPDKWISGNMHQAYCRGIFIAFRQNLSGNPQILFDLICEAMENRPQDKVYYISHEEFLANMIDRAFTDTDPGRINFSDYLQALTNVTADLLGHSLVLNTHHSSQTILLPWYQSLTWKHTRSDGIYFVPSDFFKLIFYGL